MWASAWACEQLRKARKYSIVRSVKPAVPPVEFLSNGYGNPQGRASVGSSNGPRQTPRGEMGGPGPLLDLHVAIFGLRFRASSTRNHS